MKIQSELEKIELAISNLKNYYIAFREKAGEETWNDLIEAIKRVIELK